MSPTDTADRPDDGNDGGITELVLITGLSGSGKSSVAKCMEDLGYFCVDNLPVSLLEPLLENPSAHVEGVERVAVVTDVRAPGLSTRLPELLQRLDRHQVSPFVLFLDTSDEVLVRRFSETRRRHPLGADSTVIEAIRRERDLLEEVRGAADRILDTSEYTIHEVRAEVYRQFDPRRFARSSLTVSLVSFGFKRGIPYGSDLLFDVRFLPNPYFVDGLRQHSGLDREVIDYLEATDDFPELVSRLSDLIQYLLPRFRAENRSYLTIAIGCTGGRHRSVAVVERLAAGLESAEWTVRVMHRDISREGQADASAPPDPVEASSTPDTAEAGSVSSSQRTSS